jgi:hypothetical protein
MSAIKEWISPENVEQLHLHVPSLDADQVALVKARALAIQQPDVREKLLTLMRPCLERALRQRSSPDACAP